MARTSLFVSHSSHDNIWCRDFVAGLQGDGWDVWYDEKGLSGGAGWVATIQNEIELREIFLLVLTPNAWDSRWVREELDLALATNRQIIPVLYKPTQVEGFIRTRQRINVVGLSGLEAAKRVADTLSQSQSKKPTSSILNGASLLRPGPSATTIPSDRFPSRLVQLGYQGIAFAGAEVILPPLCQVPTGAFLMGSDPTRDEQLSEDERPQHWLNPPGFSIARFPVTVAEYACFVRTGHAEPTFEYDNPPWEVQCLGPDHPVVNVSWNDATAYAAWLAEKTGQPWRLPSEAEWEKAARWDSVTRTAHIYPWGDSFEKGRCNIFNGGNRTTTQVGSYPSGASPYGAMDMAGNVWEWTSSLYRPYPYKSEDGREAPDLTGDRVLRGGCWGSTTTSVRAAFRGGHFMVNKVGIKGFRIALGTHDS